MPAARIDRSVLRDNSWWHWAVTVPLLAAHVAGRGAALPIAIGLCAAVAAYYIAQLRRVRPYPVQVRLAYLVLLGGGLLPGFHWLHWVQLVGTTSMVSAGYCPLARVLMLLPFNRSERFSARLVWQRLWTDPCAGGIIAWDQPHRDGAPACACSLRTGHSSAVSRGPCDAAATAAARSPER